MELDAAQTDASNADATGGEPIFRNGTGIGRVTSGAYGYHVGKSLALGYVKNAGPGDEVEVMVLGRPHKAVILDRPPFDPEGERLRA
jgi:dimethylglycine dehydrogenase